MNNDPTPKTIEQRSDKELDRPSISEGLGRIAFRAMVLDEHEGIVPVNEHGWVEYPVNNPHFPDQGDHVFHGADAHLNALTYAYPRKHGQLHAILTNKAGLVPLDNRVGYIPNGAQVQAIKLPDKLVDNLIDKFDDELTQQEILTFVRETMPPQTSEK